MGVKLFSQLCITRWMRSRVAAIQTQYTLRGFLHDFSKEPFQFRCAIICMGSTLFICCRLWFRCLLMDWLWCAFSGRVIFAK